MGVYSAIGPSSQKLWLANQAHRLSHGACFPAVPTQEDKASLAGRLINQLMLLAPPAYIYAAAPPASNGRRRGLAGAARTGGTAAAAVTEDDEGSMVFGCYSAVTLCDCRWGSQVAWLLLERRKRPAMHFTRVLFGSCNLCWSHTHSPTQSHTHRKPCVCRSLHALTGSLGPLLAQRSWQQGSYCADVVPALTGDAFLSGALCLNKSDELLATATGKRQGPSSAG